MSDEGFDPCECMHHLSVQHLFSILRSQDYCTDTECFNMSRLPGPEDVQESTNFISICLIIGFILLMFAFRPGPLRLSRNDVVKDRDNEPSSRQDPPSPPTIH